MATPEHRVGARPVGARDRGRKRRGLVPLLLALLALLAIAALLIALLAGDDDKGSANSGAAQSAQQPGAAASGAGQLEAGGQALLPPPGGKLDRFVGQDTVGQDVTVQAIVKGQGFWVGTSRQDRIYVEYGGEVGKTEAGFRPDRTGQRVDLDGPVRPAPQNPAETLKLSAADAQQVASQGAYINANKVSPRGG